MILQTPFKRLVLRVVLRDVYPMVIRLVAVPDFLLLTDFDDLFHALLGWESGASYAFRLHGQEFNSLRRRTKTKRLCDFRCTGKSAFSIPLASWTSGSGRYGCLICRMDPRVTKDPFVWTDAGQHRRSIVAVPPDTV